MLVFCAKKGSEKMIDRLETMLSKYNELTEKLTSLEVLNDYNLLRDISKEKSDLEETVTIYKEYKNILKSLQETKIMLEDPELKDIASDEITFLEGKEKDRVLNNMNTYSINTILSSDGTITELTK